MIAGGCAAAVALIVITGLGRPHRSLLAPRRRRPVRDPTAAVIGVLEVAAREVRTGSSLAQALRHAQAAHPDALPTPPGTASHGARRPRQPAWVAADQAIAVQALTAAATLGGQPAAALDDAAAVLRERRAVRAERAVQSAQARLSARVLTVVPLGFAGWAALASGSTRRVYTGSPLGALAVAAGLAANLAGWWWMRRIVGRVR